MLSRVIGFSLITSLALAAPTLTKRQVSSKIQANDGSCLGFTGTHDISNGTPIGSVDCNSDAAITWNFNPQSPSSITPASNSGFALDAGSDPENFGKLKLWQSYPTLYQQTWWYTADNRVAIYNGNQCLDDGNGLQLYQCTTGNTNQIFTYNNSPPPSSSVSSSQSPSSTVSSSSAPQFTSGGHYTITYKDCAPGGGGLGCEIQQPTPTAGEIVATVTLS